MTMTDSRSFDTRYNGLNDEQKKAVDTIDGPVLVIAGPGSGKTELLSLRVCNILRQTDTLPSSILCLTFMDSASANMRKRLAGLIGQDAYKVAIHTFHSFGSEIINRNPEYFYHGAAYGQADKLMQYEIMEEILKSLSHEFHLRSYHPDQGYTYLDDILARIGDMKKGGLEPSDFRQLLEENKSFLEEADKLVAPVFAERMSKNTVSEIPSLLEKISAISFTQRSRDLPYLSMKETLAESLQKAYDLATAEEKPDTKPLTEWKRDFMRKNDRNEITLADLERLKKQFELCYIYEEYQKRLHEKGFYDFDDMLLDASRALTEFPELKYNLQERFLYVLVDEFQDTNGVQMRILDQLLDAEVNEGRPNILVVGDDDQAIFKFQGANIANIMSFHKKYREPSIIVLQKNYRSTQPILDYARKTILTGNDRLEKQLPDIIKKELLSANKGLVAGEILEKDFTTSLHELVWIAENIKEKIAAGTSAAEIAVIAPKHYMLEEAAKVLDYCGITVSYERQRDLFAQNHITELITILRFINTIAIIGRHEADDYLPKILSFPFWGISKLEIWKISVAASRGRKLWLEAMLASENKQLRDIAEFLILLGIEAKESTAEEIIDRITGVGEAAPGEDEDPRATHEQATGVVAHTAANHDAGAKHAAAPSQFHSPYKQFYFSDAKLKDAGTKYLDLLQSLRAFVDKIREYKGVGARTVAEAVDFVNLHETHKQQLNYKSVFNEDVGAVKLLTAHGAKGLEFENVYILNCSEKGWMKNRAGDKLNFPANVPLSPENENEEDYLRLFFVSLTRAKRNLYLCTHRYDDKGNELIKLRYLDSAAASEPAKKQNITLENVKGMQEEIAERKGMQKFLELKFAVGRHEVMNADESALIGSLLKDYKLSVTHLNNFLDVANGGPQKFIESNLLQFPQKMLPSNSFGTATHEALNRFAVKFKATKILPPPEYLLEQFEKSLEEMRLNKEDFRLYLKKGRDSLGVYYEKRKDDFRLSDQSEFNFRGQGVVIGEAEITGKIDKMVYDDDRKEITVYDYKTGKALKDWEHGQGYDKIKSLKNTNQLIFYKLLVENARDFKGKYKVNTGFLEFLEPVGGEIKLLQLNISEEAAERLKKLIRVVYKKILNLDFPDISGYSKDAEGINAFTEDLLAG
jgi:DNA helicase II / ATP-dependent DNA helicase PcrA